MYDRTCATAHTCVAGNPLRSLRALAALLSLPLLSACSYIPWFGGEEDPTPPTELTAVVPEVGVTTLWSKEVGKGSQKRRLSLVPAYQGGRLFLADAKGLVSSVGAGDGRVLWQRETGLPMSGGPEVSGDRLYLGSSDGDVVALSSADGTEIWRAQVPSEILSVPKAAGETLVVHTLDDGIYGFDIATGERRWEFGYRAPILTLRGSSTPVISGNYAVVGVSDGKLVKLDLADGVPVWETTVTPPRGRSELERIADLDATPLLVGDILYVCTFNGDLAAVELTSGTVLWRRELSCSAGLAAADEVLYVTDSDDLVYAAKSSDGAGIWKQEGLKYRNLSAPAVIGDLVVVGDLDGNVHWLSRRDGRIVARDDVADGPITARPLVAEGRVFVYGDDGTLAALSPGGARPTR
jgi:outer membrane protein assembly factor BamB